MEVTQDILDTAKASGVGVSPRGINMQLYSGRPFFLTDPDVREVDIKDIAHSLANQCRFNGHTKKFYSVAQHSVIVSENVPSRLALEGLLHDAGETYVTDLAKPVKVLVEGAYTELEHTMDLVICEAFDLSYEDCHAGPVKIADKRLVATERRDLMQPSAYVNWGDIGKGNFIPYSFKIIPVSPEEAEEMFLKRYYELVDTKAINYLKEI